MEDIVILAGHTYFIAAILYNVASQVSLDVFKRKFAPTDPVNGILIVSFVYMLFMLSNSRLAASPLFLIAVFTLAIIRFGIVQHLLNFDGETYLSKTSWLAAIIINVFGVSILTAYLFTKILMPSLYLE